MVLSPKWILWHLLAILAVATCVVAAVWQWDRAGSALGSALNVGYGVQWPIFAVFFAYMWWRFLRMDLQEHRAAAVAVEPEPETVTAVAPSPQAPEGPAPWETRRTVAPIDESDSPALTEYNRMLAALAADDVSDKR